MNLGIAKQTAVEGRKETHKKKGLLLHHVHGN